MARISNIGVGKVLIGLVLLLVLGFAVGESMGWPWLVKPLQDQLEKRLERRVQLQQPDGPAATPNTTATTGARLHFWGGVNLKTGWLEVAAPSWSKAPYLVSARDVDVDLRYTDLWRAYRGQPLVIKKLGASWLDAVLERQADGKASWQGAATDHPSPAPQLETTAVQVGNVRYNDAILGLEVLAKGNLANQKLALQLTAKAGPARLTFDGHADDITHWDRVQGKLTVQGPSLADMGAPLGVTLPTTAPFKAQGELAHGDGVWDMKVDSAEIGKSQLSGNFHFDTRGSVPVLSGTLTGERLNLVDLGPAVGVETDTAKKSAKVLPTRPFDLASLRAMDADVNIAIKSVDLNTALLEPLQPLNGHLKLDHGVLTLTNIDARTSQGRLTGALTLNGEKDRAHWVAALQWQDVLLDRWLRLTRREGLPPYVTGKLQGHANVSGDGRSTAEILGSLQGQVVTTVTEGSVSHLLIELGGLDAAQALGVFVKGDKSLPLDCAVADLTVSQGSLKPRVLVLDTTDSTAWIDGSISLATESMDLRAIVAPKDISPLSLRTPLHVGGTFAAPKISIEKAPLGAKLGSALLLGLLNPLAAIIPLVDTGSSEAAKQHALTCQARLQKKMQQSGAKS